MILGDGIETDKPAANEQEMICGPNTEHRLLLAAAIPTFEGHTYKASHFRARPQHQTESVF